MIPESRQKKLIAECQRQMKVLLEQMNFQKLQQGYRMGQALGYLFDCRSVAGLNSVTVRMKQDVGGGAVVGEVCWCGEFITLGVVTECIEGHLSDHEFNCAPCNAVDDPPGYPGCALGNPFIYAGARYKVRACLKTREGIFCCVPSDWEIYEVDDIVALLILPEEGEWTTSACNGSIRDKTEDEILDGIDHQYLILPYILEEIEE